VPSTGDGPPDHDVQVPPGRYDCEVEIDIVEEVARQYGYERLGKTMPRSTHPGHLSELQIPWSAR